MKQTKTSIWAYRAKAAVTGIVSALTLSVFSLATGAAGVPDQGRNNTMPQADSIPIPPAQQRFTAPGGRYELILTMSGSDPARWATTGSDGVLQAIISGTPHERWRRHFPHNYRPRTALVANDGTVLLFDQWINVLGPHALTIINPEGQTVASYSFDDIAVALGVTRAQLAATNGKLGPWRTGDPKLDPNGKTSQVAAGGKTLSIRLSDGVLGALP